MIAAWVVDRSGDEVVELGRHAFVTLPRTGEAIGVMVDTDREWFVVERLHHHAEPVGSSEREPHVTILVVSVKAPQTE